MNRLQNPVLLFLLLGFLSGNALAQTLVFTQRHPTTAFGSAVASAPDKGYVVAGSYQYWASATKVDSTGQIEWLSYGPGEGNYQDIVATQSGDYYLLGTRDYEGAIAKLDGQGNEVWYNRIGGHFVSGLELPNGEGVALGGYTSWGQLLLLRFANDGTVLDSSSYPSMLYARPQHLARRVGGGYSVIGGMGPTGRRAFIATFSDSLDLLAYHEYPDYEFSRHLSMDDGGFLVTGHWVDWPDAHKRLLRIDSVGAIVWEQDYGIGANEAVVSIEADPDSGYVLVSTDNLPPFNREIWIMRTNDLGDSLKAWRWSDTIYHNSRDLIYEPGGYVVLATNSDHYHFISKFGLSELVEASDPASPEEAAVRIYPQPAADQVHFFLAQKAEWIEIWDMAGRLIIRLEDPGTVCDVDVSGLNPGMYAYRIQAKSDLVSGRLMIR